MKLPQLTGWWCRDRDDSVRAVIRIASQNEAVFENRVLTFKAGVDHRALGGEVLSIVAVTPSSGWAVVDAEQEDRFHVEVGFRSGNLFVEFHASYVFGVGVTSVETEVVDGAPTGNDSGGTATTAADEGAEDDGDEGAVTVTTADEEDDGEDEGEYHDDD